MKSNCPNLYVQDLCENEVARVCKKPNCPKGNERLVIFLRGRKGM